MKKSKEKLPDWPDWSNEDKSMDDDLLKMSRILFPYLKLLNPRIIEAIVNDNKNKSAEWEDKLLEAGVENFSNYFWNDSPVAFPCVRRYVKGEKKNDVAKDAIYIDDNDYPKQIWSFVFRKRSYGHYGPGGYSHAQVLDPKDYNSRLKEEFKGDFSKYSSNNSFGAFHTSAANALYTPSGFLKPTDNDENLRMLLIELIDKTYGSVCDPFPNKWVGNYDRVPPKWRLESFADLEQPEKVGDLSNINCFIDFRFNRMKKLIEDFPVKLKTLNN